MITNYSFFTFLLENQEVLTTITQAISMIIGPTEKTIFSMDIHSKPQILTNGLTLLKKLTFSSKKANTLKKLVEQASLKTFLVSGSGSSLTIFFICQILQKTFKFILAGYNRLLLSKGLLKLLSFLIEKTYYCSSQVIEKNEFFTILKILFYKGYSNSFYSFMKTLIPFFSRDTELIIEEGTGQNYEIEEIQGIELDKGYISPYFLTDLANPELIYEKAKIFIPDTPLISLKQINIIVEECIKTNQSLIIITDDIKKELLSNLLLLKIKKNASIVVIKYNSIKFVKNGFLEDLALLTQSNYFEKEIEKKEKIYTLANLGYAEKVKITKEKSTFFLSNFSKTLIKRRKRELWTKFLECETDYEKVLIKNRISRLSGNALKVKIPKQNEYQFIKETKILEKFLGITKSSLEEGILTGGGVFFLTIKKEIQNWSYINLIGDEFFASYILKEVLSFPFSFFCSNTNSSFYFLVQQIEELGYPYCYDFNEKKFGKNTIIDSAKSIRSIFWNSLTLSSSILTSE